MIYLPDVNVWIALASNRHIHHRAAKNWFKRLETGKIAFCRITEIGFLRLLTNRHVMHEDAATPKEAWKIYDELRQDRQIIFLDEIAQVSINWRQKSAMLIGGQNIWTDSYIAAFAAAYNAKLVTFDQALGARTEAEVLVANNSDD